MGKKFLQFLPLIGLLVLIGLGVYGYQLGVFASVHSLQKFIDGFGQYGVLIFILLQILQVIVPILPGGISTVVGLVMFGTLKGIIYSYIGLIIGEVLGFLLIRHYGIDFARKILTEKKFTQFQDLLEKSVGRVRKVLIFTLLVPFAPDDIVCLVAGLTTLPFKDFLRIILILKPWSIAIYSLFMLYLFKKAEGLL